MRYYFHHTDVVREATAPDHHTRGERVKEIESDLLQKRGGRGYASVAFDAMRSIHHNTGERQILQVLNGGAVDGIAPDASVEVACVLDKAGPHPIRFGAIPLPIRGLIQAVKAYESLTVQAAVEGSERIAMQALMAHPLIPPWEVAKTLLTDLLAANRE